MTLGSFVLFVFAASLPVVFLLVVSRWIELKLSTVAQKMEKSWRVPGCEGKTLRGANTCTRNTGERRPDAKEHQPNIRGIEICYDWTRTDNDEQFEMTDFQAVERRQVRAQTLFRRRMPSHGRIQKIGEGHERVLQSVHRGEILYFDDQTAQARAWFEGD